MGDKIIGDSGDNYLLGGLGDDTLNGGAGADTMEGATGNDLYFVDNAGDVVVENADEGHDTVRSSVDWALGENLEDLVLLGSAVSGYGNALDNRITGNKDDNDLYGGEGNDTLNGGLGADVLAGGAGDDLYVVDNDKDQIVEEFDQGHDTVRSSVSWTLGENFEDLILLGSAVSGLGNALDNRITGNDIGNDLSGGDGNDTLNGGAGADTLNGGKGDDLYVVDDANDLVVESALEGHDTVRSSVDFDLNVTTEIEDLVLTGDANLTGSGNELANRITGNSGDNNLLGWGGDDLLLGAAGNDTLDGGDGGDTLRGGAGDDTYFVADANDKVIESTNGGDDLVWTSVDYKLGANVERLQITGGSLFYGNSGDNFIVSVTSSAVTIYAGAGNDYIETGTFIWSSTLIGGDGDDYYVFDGRNDIVVEAVGGGEDTIEARGKDLDLNFYANVENAVLGGLPYAANITGNALDNEIGGNWHANAIDGGEGNDTIFGDRYGFNSGGNDTLHGGNGDDSIQGSAGSDLLDGGDGADTLSGGRGNDVYVVGDFDTVIEGAGQGRDTVKSSVDWWLSDNPAVEDLVLTGEASGGFGNALANVITGSSVDNLLFGDGGDDSLSGGEGNDYLDGSTGDDTMLGGAGDDVYVVDAAGDQVIEAADDGAADLVYASVNYTLGANVENLRVFGGTYFVGNGRDNSITNTTDLTLTIDGGDGNDQLLSGTGKATLIGGAGDDHYIFRIAEDAVVEAAGGGDDTVEIWYSGNIDLGSFANVENLVIGFPVTGSGTTATGNALANKITGNGTANILNGADGNDTLDGGGGADQLTGGAGSDTFDITLLQGLDSITDFQSGTNGDTLDVSDLLRGYDGVTSDANDFVRFTASGGDTLVQVDADGVGVGFGFADTVLLKGVSLTDVGQAIADGNLILQSSEIA